MTVMTKHDLVVIGAGPGGYVAAIRAAQLGMKVACVERMPRPGGVCLNVGCIPSKCLLDSSENLDLLERRLPTHGIEVEGIRLDLATMMARKDRVVQDLCNNVRGLLEGNGVSLIQGSARLTGPTTVDVSPASERANGDPIRLEARSILLATGSEPIELPNLPFDGNRIIGSTEALSLESVPEHLGVVGGGYIGLELGSVWQRLGSRVTVIEMLPSIAGLLDGQLSRTLHRVLARQGMEFQLNTRVLRADVDGRKALLHLQTDRGEDTLECDKVLVAVGRRPLTRNLGLEEAGIRLHPRTGHVLVDDQYRTSVLTVFAIGDLVEGPALAHKASAEGIAAVECMAGLPGEVNYDAMPAVVYTFPEVASVGMTEEQGRERLVPYCVGTYPFSGAGRARCMGESDGFVKLIVHSKTDRLLGAHIIGPRASDLIGECVLAMQLKGTSKDIGGTVHGHPTFSEAVREAALASRKCAIYAP